MTKTYCDKCNAVIDASGKGNNPDQEGEVNIGSGRHIFKIGATIEKTEGHRGSDVRDEREDLHICLYCRIDALKLIDNRARPADVAATKLSRVRELCNNVSNLSAFQFARNVIDVLNS